MPDVAPLPRVVEPYLQRGHPRLDRGHQEVRDAKGEVDGPEHQDTAVHQRDSSLCRESRTHASTVVGSAPDTPGRVSVGSAVNSKLVRLTIRDDKAEGARHYRGG